MKNSVVIITLGPTDNYSVMTASEDNSICKQLPANLSALSAGANVDCRA